MVITFEDRSTATIFASDGVLGGVRNTMNVYLSNAVVHVNMNPHNVLEVYAPEDMSSATSISSKNWRPRPAGIFPVPTTTG